jgi:hypothetical protein
MVNSSARQNALTAAKVFGIIPCILGVSIGLSLRWGGIIWLTSAGGFWPIVCLSASIAILIKRAISPFEDRMACGFAWLIITWTWLYFPLWLMATAMPSSSGVISRQGHVYITSEWTRQPTDTVWLLTGRTGNRVVQNVTGTINVKSVDVQYRYNEMYVATRSDNEDLSQPVISATNTILTVEAGNSRSSRIALFDRREVHDRLLDRICRAAVPASMPCPLKLSLSPQIEATTLGSVWSKYYTEKEAVDEQHLPALIQLLTQEKSQPVDRDRVFALFMELAVAADDLSKVARKAGMLSEKQFDDLIKRILVSPTGADEAVSILTEVVRLKQDQRQRLRAKVFREAKIEVIVKHIVPLRISDAEVAQLAVRMRAAFATSPNIAAIALEHFGERIPPEIQHDAVRAIVDAKASYAIAALEYLNFSEKLREELLDKLLTDANYDDFDSAHISREKLEDMLTPEEMRPLIASAIRKSESSAKWLDFAVHKLPIRLMTLAERKSILNGLLFVSHKSALEFASENRNYLEVVDVDEITRDYTRTIAPELCLHLSHRNKIRKIDYFSATQLQIFRDCAQSK